MSGLALGLLKWFICCAALVVMYLVFGEIGILFGVGFDLVILSHM